MANFHGSDLCINGSEVYTNGYCTAIVVLLFQLVKQSSFCVQCILAIFCVQSSLACSWPPAPCPWRLTPVLPPSSLPISPSSSPMSPPGGRGKAILMGAGTRLQKILCCRGAASQAFLPHNKQYGRNNSLVSVFFFTSLTFLFPTHSLVNLIFYHSDINFVHIKDSEPHIY